MEARFLTAIGVVLGLVAVGCVSASDGVGGTNSGSEVETVVTASFPFATAPTAPSTTSSFALQPPASPAETGGLRTIDVAGHRGARGVRPENTLPSFEAALDAGVDTLELDLHLSHDGQLMIWHDPEITADKCRIDDQKLPDPTTLPSVRSLTAAELALYVCDLNPDPDRFPDQEADPGDVSAGNYSMMTLPQLFEFVDRYANDDQKTDDQRRNATTVQFNVETKRRPDRPETIGDGFDGTNPGEFEQALALLIDDWGYANRVVVQSFDHRSLWALRELAPDVRLAALTLDEQPDFQAMSDSGAYIWSPHFTSLTTDVIADAKSFGLDVIPWTVNTEEDVCALLVMGVAGLITDRPDLVLGERGWLTGCQADK